MKKIFTFLLACSAFVPLTWGQTVDNTRYLDDKYVTRLSPNPMWEVPVELQPNIYPTSNNMYSGYQAYVYCKERAYCASCQSDWGGVYWFDLKGENGTPGKKYYAYRVNPKVNNTLISYDGLGRGITSNGKYIIHFRTRMTDASVDKPTPATGELYPVSQFVIYEPVDDPKHPKGEGGKHIKTIELSKTLNPSLPIDYYTEIRKNIGAPADIACWGDIMGATGGYIVFAGVSGNPYVVNKKIAKVDLINGNIEKITYFDVPEIADDVRQIYLKGLDQNRVIVDLRSSTIGIYNFSLNGGLGGWEPEFQIKTGYDVNGPIKNGRGMNLGTTGFCAFQMKGPKNENGVPIEPRNIFLFPTGAPNYTENFTGYDIENYRFENGSPNYEDCYYYAPGVVPSNNIVCHNYNSESNLFNNFLFFRQDPNDPSLGYVYQIRPNLWRASKEELAKVGAGNTLRCYKIQILPSDQVFLKPAEGKTITYGYDTTDAILGCPEINSLKGRVEFKNATIPTTYLKLEDQLSIVDYWASRYDHTGDASAPYKQEPDRTLTQTNNTFDFTYLSQPIDDAKGGKIFDKTYAAKGPYRIKGYVHYQWYGQVNFKSPVYECDIQPNYESSSAVPVNYKNVWVQGRPYDGGQNINPSKLYVPINFNPSKSSTPVSVYRVNCVDKKTGKRKLVKEIHGDFDFANRDNMNNHLVPGTNMPDQGIKPSDDTNFPFVCVHEIVADKAAAEEFAKNHYYEVKTVYGLNAHKVRRSYGAEIPVVEGGVVTSVEGVNEDEGFSVTPTLVDGHMDVTCGEGVNAIDVYSLSGALVKHFDGNGNTFESVIVDDLARGTYFVKVNNTKVVKIIKR